MVIYMNNEPTFKDIISITFLIVLTIVAMVVGMIIYGFYIRASCYMEDKTPGVKAKIWIDEGDGVYTVKDGYTILACRNLSVT